MTGRESYYGPAGNRTRVRKCSARKVVTSLSTGLYGQRAGSGTLISARFGASFTSTRRVLTFGHRSNYAPAHSHNDQGEQVRRDRG